MNNWLKRDGEEEAGKGRKRKERGGRGRKGRRNGNGEGETLLRWDRRRLKRSRTRWWRMRRKRKWLRRGAWGGFLWLLAASWELVCMDCHFLNNRFSTNRFGVHALTLYNWASRYWWNWLSKTKFLRLTGCSVEVCPHLEPNCWPFGAALRRKFLQRRFDIWIDR